MKLKVVVFDVDGTLYPNGSMYLRSILFGLTNFKTLTAFAQVRKRIRSIKPIYNFHAQQAELFAGLMNLPSNEAAEKIQRIFYDEWEQLILDIKPYPYLREVLQSIKSRGCKLAVLSDFPIGNKLSYLGLDSFWDATYSCEEIGYLKPNPEPFKLLTAYFGVQPHEVLFVGNSYKYDIIGAKRVGFHTAYLNCWPRWCPAADFKFSHYGQLKRWVESLQD